MGGNGLYSNHEYKNYFTGKTTSTGKICRRIVDHAIEQAIKRCIYPESMMRTLESNDIKEGSKGNRTIFIRNGLHVVYDNDTNEIITVIYKGKGR